MKKTEQYRRALLEVYQTLGPAAGSCKANKCEGCQVEMDEAAEVAWRALQLPKPKKVAE